MADYLKRTMYNGGWMGRGGCSFGYMAGGHMNAAGVHDVTFLLLAKECGVDVDEYLLQTTLKHFYRYAGHWNVSYGDGLPEGGGVDNGKNGGLAFTMAAAATLSPDGEKSVYAKARDISANKSFYTTSWLFHGHTGGGIGELWRGAAAGLLSAKRPEMYRSFMNERRWMYELARRHDGSFGWASGMNVGYGTTGHKGGNAWGNYIPLIYTVPRKQLRIYGAPSTKYCQTHSIPERPWGTAADEAFYSLEPGEYKPGKRQDMSEERLPTHASWPLLRWMGNPEVSDEDLLMFAHHPDSTAQGTAAGSISKQQRIGLILPLLKSKDPRARLAGIRAAAGNQKGADTPVELTDEMIEIISSMINDPEESWWVVMGALEAIALAPPEKIAPLAGRLEYWLKHDDWWLRQAALKAVTPIAVDKQFYKKILPIVGDMIANNERAAALGPVGGIVSRLAEADADVQKFAAQVLGQAYSHFPTEFVAPGGQDMSSGVTTLLGSIARNLSNVPGGFDVLYEVSRKRFPQTALPHKDLYMGADASNFGPTVAKAIKPIVLEQLIPRYVGAPGMADALRAEAQSIPTKAKGDPKMDELVRLYNRIDVHDYDWHVFGPDLGEIKWDYFTFDPKEEKIWEPGWRYRSVTVPTGMTDWTKPEFNAAAAGWKKGVAPFGQFGGKLVTEEGDCKMDFCRCGEPMKTFWENEVLIMRAKLKYPEFKEGYRYRLVVGGMSHVNGGDGFEIYLNGKQILQQPTGIGKRAGGRPVCTYITKDMWPSFAQEVTIAAKAFLPIPGGKRSPGVKKNHFSVWIQEMKVPDITEEMVSKGKALQPLLSSAWQASREENDKYIYDGDFTSNKSVLGDWEPIGQVAKVDEFEPGSDLSAAGKSPLSNLSLNSDGKTGNPLVMWSGDTLVDLEKYQALKMVPDKIDGQDYLFVESGGFDNRKPADWTSPWTVFKRKGK